MAGGGELVGRELERRALSERFDQVRAGNGGLLLLAGEAGVGKTSLAEAALAISGLVVLRGVVSDQGRTPYAPIVTAMRAYDRIAPGALRESGHLASHLSVLLPELGAAPGTIDHLALAEALREAFAEMAGRQPTVVFLDDLQWGDETTLELLPSLAASVVTSRSSSSRRTER